MLWVATGVALVAALTLSVAEGGGVLALLLTMTVVIGTLVLLRPEWGVFLLTSTFFLSYPDALQGSGKLTINNVLGLLLMAILLIRFVIERKTDFLASRPMKFVLLVGFAVLVNQLLTDSAPPLPGFEQLDLTDLRMHDIVSKFLYLVFVIAFIRKRWQVTVLASAIVLFVLITAPSAILNAVTAWGAPKVTDVESIRASATVGIMAARNANRLAFVSTIGIAVIACLITEIRSRAAWVLGGVAIALLTVTIFLTASRSGLLAVLVLAVILAPRVGIRPMRVVAVGLTGIVLLTLVVSVLPNDRVPNLVGGRHLTNRFLAMARRTSVPQAYLDRIGNFLLPQREGGGASESTGYRLELLSVSGRMIADHPLLGVGLGNFRWTSVTEYGNRHLSALHNAYVLAAVEGGLLLFVPYLALFWITWTALAALRRLAVERPDVGLGWLVDATRAVFVMFLVFSAFADIWHEVYLYLVVGLTVVLTRLYVERPAA